MGPDKGFHSGNVQVENDSHAMPLRLERMDISDQEIRTPDKSGQTKNEIKKPGINHFSLVIFGFLYLRFFWVQAQESFNGHFAFTDQNEVMVSGCLFWRDAGWDLVPAAVLELLVRSAHTGLVGPDVA